jgi:Flp pilus assembly protein TadG
MTWKAKPHILRFLGRTKGAVAVEFAVIGTLFLLLVAGVIDFGHAFYMKQAITNASREGARYGITYTTNASGVRVAPNALSPTIKNYILTKYLTSGLLPDDANPSVTLGGAGYTTGTKGAPLEVTVTATKTWFMVSGFVPGLGDQKTLGAKTVMLCE